MVTRTIPAGDGRPVDIASGLEALVAASGPLERLRIRTQTPITARGDWIECWLLAHPDHEPWIVSVPAEDRSALDAAVVLAVHRRAGLDRIMAAGHGLSDHMRLPAIDDSAAKALAGGIARMLADRRRPWRLEIEQLPSHDPVAIHLLTLLANVDVTVEAGGGSPWLELQPTPTGSLPTVADHLSTKHRKELRRLGRRLAERGEVSIDRHTEPDAILALLPEIGRLRRRRDAEQDRRSGLDEAAGQVFWPLIMRRLAHTGDVEVITLRCDQTLVGYVTALRDGPAYRVWGGRMHPDWAPYRVGAMIDAQALGIACAEGFEAFDLMRGESAYKLRLASDVQPASTLRAWSSAIVERADQQRSSLLHWLRDVKDDAEWLGRLWRRIKRARRSG